MVVLCAGSIWSTCTEHHLNKATKRSELYHIRLIIVSRILETTIDIVRKISFGVCLAANKLRQLQTLDYQIEIIRPSCAKRIA